MHSEIEIVGVLLAAGISGATGLAFPLIAGPIFLLEHPPAEAILLTSICSLIGQLCSIVLLRKTVSFAFNRELIFPGLLGIPLGTELLGLTNSNLLRVAFGIMLLISSACLLIRPRQSFAVSGSPRSDRLVGFCGGVCGGLLGTSAVIPAIWFCRQGLVRVHQRAIMQPYIIIMQLASFLTLLAHGVGSSLRIDELVVWPPVILTGVSIGTLMFRRMSCAFYSQLVIIITFASGCALAFHK